jgi:hypothetical protein
VSASGSRLLQVVLSTVLVLGALVVAGCPAGPQRLVTLVRTPGEKLTLALEATEKKYACSPRRKSFHLEEVQVLPRTIAPGTEVNHRLRYALCPAEPRRGSIAREVVFRGQTVFRDEATHVFKSGTWTVDAFIGVPKDAQDGTYKIETVLTYRDQTVRATSTFRVKRVSFPFW